MLAISEERGVNADLTLQAGSTVLSKYVFDSSVAAPQTSEASEAGRGQCVQISQMQIADILH